MTNIVRLRAIVLVIAVLLLFGEMTLLKWPDRDFLISGTPPLSAPTTLTISSFLFKSDVAGPLVQPMSNNKDHQPVMKLADWEIESGLPNGVCQPPLGIPTYCCLGSMAYDGGPVKFRGGQCRMNATGFDIGKYTSEFISSDDKSSCDVCDIVDTLMANNWTLSFVGDSITRQSFAGLECALYKEFGTVERQFRKANRTNIHRKLSQEQRQRPWEYGIKDVTTLRVTAPNKSNKTEINNATAVIQYFSVFRSLDDMAEIREILQHSDVVVFDFGLHFKPSSELPLFHQVVQNLYKAKPSSTMLVWRETSAQHFDTPGGHFIDQRTQCAPIQSGIKPVRRSVVANATNGHLKLLNEWTSTDDVLLLEYRNFTSGLHHLHNPGTQDCTHFCSTPFLWMPIWHGLRLGIQKAVRLRTETIERAKDVVQAIQ